MTKPMLLADFTRLPPATRAIVLDGLSGAIDLVAEAAPETHRFLRYQWFAAALAAYGGAARTILIEHDGDPVIALPMTRFGPGPAHLAAVPGGYAPFRSFPASTAAEDNAFRVLVDSLGHEVNALRIGPVPDGDPALDRLIQAARAKGWAVLDRFVADIVSVDSHAVESPADDRAASALDHRILTGADWRAESFELLAAVEEKHDVAGQGCFTAASDGLFWRGAAEDPALADMMLAVVASVGDTPAAFAFGLRTGSRYRAIAEVHDAAFSSLSLTPLLRRRLIDLGIERIDGVAGMPGAGQGSVIRDWMLVRPGLPAMLGRALRSIWERGSQRPVPQD